MNKSELKNFAIRARLSLRERVQARAALYGVTPAACANKTIVPSADFRRLDGGVLTGREIRQRAALIARVTQIGYESAMEEAAYTWFNRIVAIKYLQEHNLLPLPLRALPDAPGETPQLLRQAQDVTLPGVDPDTVLQLLDQNRADELYKYLLIALCNALAEPLPGMFETIREECELLFPDSLLKEDSVPGELARLEPDSWQEIQVIGWLYQYYISQRHEEVVDINGGAIAKEDIPAATCLYTTEWVVHYMVENSLGRLWLEGHPDENLRMKWRYFMDEAPQTPEVTEKLRAIRTPCAGLQPEQLTVLDPCMGSGHILVYAFDVLMDIYRSVGYTDRDAARSILEHNLCGLDIDDRAAQLAYFAVMMKACEYDRRFLRRGVQPHVCAVQESAPLDAAALSALGPERPLAEKLLQTFADGKEYGSLLQPELTEGELTALEKRLNTLETGAQETLLTLAGSAQAAEALRPLLRQARLLTRKYHAVITNPPYMNKFSPNLKRFVQEHYADYKADLFAVFMHRNFSFCEENGYSAFMSPFVWMFIKSYEKLRSEIIQRKCITTLIQMEYSAFEEATVPICTFVLRNSPLNYAGVYLRLSDFKGGMDVQNEKVLEAQRSVACHYRYTAQQDNFSKIPGAPVAYWVSERMLSIFQSPALNTLASPRQGLATGENDRFTRLWFEVEAQRLCLNAHDRNSALASHARWFPYNKGGDFRKWYGNNDCIVNWENDGYEIRNFYDERGKLRSVIRNPATYFQESITWSKISSGTMAFRYKPYGHVYDVAGTSIFAEHHLLMYLHGFCNSCIAMAVAKILSPTINYEVGHISNFPINIDTEKESSVETTVDNSIALSKADWDSFETSWDFKKHSMI